MEDVQHLTIRALELNGATYGVFARGAAKEHVAVERCSWIQDDRIWGEVSWHDIHNRPNPRRELDGDFFRSFDIKGNVVVRHNFIAQAFNGIHLFASRRAAEAGGVDENVWIYRNTFAFIRDSAVEAERTALNWRVFENRIYNCHTWFAFEECRGGFWYVFANRGWFDRKPGPAGDCHAGGAVIKSNPVDDAREGEALPRHPFYVFINSWYVRSPVLKKGKLRNLSHFDNAVGFARPEHHPEGVVELGRRMIGVGAPDPRCDGPAPPEAPFTTEWAASASPSTTTFATTRTFPRASAGRVTRLAASTGHLASPPGGTAITACSIAVLASHAAGAGRSISSTVPYGGSQRGSTSARCRRNCLTRRTTWAAHRTRSRRTTDPSPWLDVDADE